MVHRPAADTVFAKSKLANINGSGGWFYGSSQFYVRRGYGSYYGRDCQYRLSRNRAGVQGTHDGYNLAA